MPKGVAVSSVDEAKNAVQTVFPDAKEVSMGSQVSVFILSRCKRFFLWTFTDSEITINRSHYSYSIALHDIFV